MCVEVGGMNCTHCGSSNTIMTGSPTGPRYICRDCGRVSSS